MTARQSPHTATPFALWQSAERLTAGSELFWPSSYFCNTFVYHSVQRGETQQGEQRSAAHSRSCRKAAHAVRASQASTLTISAFLVQNGDAEEQPDYSRSSVQNAPDTAAKTNTVSNLDRFSFFPLSSSSPLLPLLSVHFSVSEVVYGLKMCFYFIPLCLQISPRGGTPLRDLNGQHSYGHVTFFFCFYTLFDEYLVQTDSHSNFTLFYLRLPGKGVLFKSHLPVL